MFVLLCANRRHRGSDRKAAGPAARHRIDARSENPGNQDSGLSPGARARPRLSVGACCGSQERKTYQVRLPLTKCGPLRDFIVASIGAGFSSIDPGRRTGRNGRDPRGGGGPGSNVRIYKRNTVNRMSVLDTIVCVTSDGLWNATLTEGATATASRRRTPSSSAPGAKSSEADHVITLRVESSTFPNWIGTDQKPSFTLSGDELKVTNRTPTIGPEVVENVWRRAP